MKEKSRTIAINMELHPSLRGATIGDQQAVMIADASKEPPFPPDKERVDSQADLGVQENTIHMLVANYPPTVADTSL